MTTMLVTDRGMKLARYADAGIPEYWVVDVPKRAVDVHTLPSENRYRKVEPYGLDEIVPKVPGTSARLRVADLFPSGIDWS